MNNWLVKQEPEDYSWADFAKEGRTGVRNFQARNNLRGMRKGDLVFYYHSGADKRIVGVARVVREAYPDSTADDGDWSAVDLDPTKPLTRPVALSTIKADPLLKEMALARNSRLSVSPVTEAQAKRLAGLSGTQFGAMRCSEGFAHRD